MNDTQTTPIEISDDDPTNEQLQLAFERAKNEFGGVHTDYESEEFTKEFHDQLNAILNEEAIQGLIDKGIAERMVRDDGQIGYNLTEFGKEVGNALVAQ
jgi:hypothetical protein